jgi:hypothetical protein
MYAKQLAPTFTHYSLRPACSPHAPRQAPELGATKGPQ